MPNNISKLFAFAELPTPEIANVYFWESTCFVFSFKCVFLFLNVLSFCLGTHKRSEKWSRCSAILQGVWKLQKQDKTRHAVYLRILIAWLLNLARITMWITHKQRKINKAYFGPFADFYRPLCTCVFSWLPFADFYRPLLTCGVSGSNAELVRTLCTTWQHCITLLTKIEALI